MVTFTVAGHPVTQGSKRAFVRNGRPILVESAGDRLKLWRHVIATAARDAWSHPPLQGPVRVDLVFALARPRSAPKRKRTWPIGARSLDVDKAARAALDAMTGVIYRDDAQVVQLCVTKDWAHNDQTGVQISIGEVTE
jgi:crossover junction endodeoxyribonuclease RusA